MVDDGLKQYRLLENSMTGERPLLAVVGNSLLMDTVEAYLVRNCSMDVVRVQADVAHTGKYLTALGPDLVIFDWDAPQATYVLSFFQKRTHIPLVGLDMYSNRAVVLSGQLNTIRTADDLCLLIQEQIRHKREIGEVKVLISKEFFERYFKELKLPVSID